MTADVAPQPAQATAHAPPVPPTIAALLRPEAYRHPADAIELRETHISWVILAGLFAYKIRKPVNLGFVDFSTRERRRADCENEVRLNRRLCPDLYLGIVDVVQCGDEFYVGGRGRPVEPAVWMRRLPESGMLTAMLERGAVTDGLVQRIARKLATFHASAATGAGVDEYGDLPTVQANWVENFEQTARFVERTIPRATFDTTRAAVERFLADHATLFARRVAEGRIRDGHGDLHAGSICVDGRRLYLFDCLEFAPRFRCADVAAEVAFLAMDLDRHGRPDLASAFVAEYVERSGDTELLQILDFYRCYRAYVRGKVRSLRLDAPGLAPDEREAIVADARAYFELSQSYARCFDAPALAADAPGLVAGMSRSGQDI